MNSSTKATTRFDLTLVGETNLDLILRGLPEQMPMERELLASGFVATLGGSSSILAHNLGVLGTRVGFVTEVGEDDLGEVAVKLLAQSRIDLSQLRRRAGATTGVTVLLPHGAHRHILTYAGVMADLRIDDIDRGYVADARHFHLSSLFLQTGLHSGLPALMRELRQQCLTVSLDTNDDPAGEWGGVLEEMLDCIDVLLPNESELLRITRKPTLEEALDTLSSRVPMVVVKCGARGAVVQQGRERSWVAPLMVDVIDTIGAGDSFNAGFLHAYLRGDSAARAAAFGNVTGALSTLRAGGVQAFREPGLMSQFLAENAPLDVPM